MTFGKLTIELDKEIWDYLIDPRNKFGTRGEEAIRLIKLGIAADRSERKAAAKQSKRRAG